jgi:hypothetical protein
MPASATDRVDQVLENYLLALAGIDCCPNAASLILKAAFAENAVTADRAWRKAIADKSSTGSSSTMEGVVAALATANRASRDALHSAEDMGTLLGLLQRGTRLAVKAAAGTPAPKRATATTHADRPRA